MWFICSLCVSSAALLFYLSSLFPLRSHDSLFFCYWFTSLLLSSALWSSLCPFSSKRDVWTQNPWRTTWRPVQLWGFMWSDKKIHSSVCCSLIGWFLGTCRQTGDALWWHHRRPEASWTSRLNSSLHFHYHDRTSQAEFVHGVEAAWRPECLSSPVDLDLHMNHLWTDTGRGRPDAVADPATIMEAHFC